MEVVYHYDLFSRKGVDVQKDAMEVDLMVPKFLRSLFMLTCEEEDDRYAGGQSAGGDVEGLFWIDQGYLDAHDRSGACKSREGMMPTTGDYSISCTPMVGTIGVFFMSSADAEKVKAKILQSIQLEIFETTRRSWAVYFGEHPIVDLSSTNIVAGATVSSRSWTEQTVGHATIESILIFGAVAVVAAISIIVLATLFNEAEQDRRNTMETQRKNRIESQNFERGLQKMRRARVVAMQNAMVNRQSAENQIIDIRDDNSVTMSYEAEPEQSEAWARVVAMRNAKVNRQSAENQIVDIRDDNSMTMSYETEPEQSEVMVIHEHHLGCTLQ